MRPVLFVLLINILIISFTESFNREEAWTGRWFPDHTTPSSLTKNNDNRVPMGVYNPECDDAKTKLEVDWLNDPINQTCFNVKSKYAPNYDTRPLYEIEEIPPLYKAAHACMNESIEYDHNIPTFGTHRPLWPKWGEYTFVPKQRWLHNLEHGGIVMLYHPCANNIEVKRLKQLVKSCLYRHIITPYNLLSAERPLALVAWGRRLQMSVVSPKLVREFIREAALHGAEHTPRDGQYSLGLSSHAVVVSNEFDEELCPKM